MNWAKYAIKRMEKMVNVTDATFYVYLHRKADTSEIFYVGKGRGKRAGRRTGRNQHWKNVVNRHGFTVEKIFTNLTEDQTFNYEKFLISHFRQIGIKLVNLCDGGEGVSGIVITPERKAYLSEINSGPNNPFYGKEFTEEHKRNISLSKVGEKHHMYDGTMRVYFHSVYGYEFATRYEMMQKYGIDPTNVSRLIRGKQKKAAGWILL